ncbi:hypothetical protein LQW54_000719 [Pestalotiopsis sp. IQ-011]
MEAFPESRKAEMAASSVLVTQLGPTTIEQSLLSLRRPLLALLLVIGSPAVNGMQNADYNEALRQRFHTTSAGSITTAPKRRAARAALAMTVEYALVLGTVANVVILGYQLSVWAVTVFALGFIGLPAIWIALAIAIHGVRVMALYAKVHVNDTGGFSPFAFRSVVVPGKNRGRKITLRMRDSRRMGQALVWILYVATMLHTLLGVVSLSGLVFISMKDSVIISVRFIANAIVCKCIFAFEAAGSKEDMTLEGGTKGFPSAVSP